MIAIFLKNNSNVDTNINVIKCFVTIIISIIKDNITKNKKKIISVKIAEFIFSLFTNVNIHLNVMINSVLIVEKNTLIYMTMIYLKKILVVIVINKLINIIHVIILTNVINIIFASIAKTNINIQNKSKKKIRV